MGTFAGDDFLQPEDYKRILAVLEVAERATGTARFRSAVLEALEEHLNLRGSAFFIAPPPAPGFRAIDGVLHGYAQAGVHEYVERWSDREPYASPRAQALIRANGIVGIEEFFDRLDRVHREYVEEFLLRQKIRSHTNLWLDTGLPSSGWISILSDRDEPLTPRARAVYLTLRPHLAVLLRHTLLSGARLPTHGRRRLSRREAEVGTLVALGCRNREIARHLGIGEDTVKKHVLHAMDKLEVRNRTQLALLLQKPESSTFVE